MMTNGADGQRLERRLATQFPEWVCVATPAAPGGRGMGQTVGFTCQRAMPAQPVEDGREDRLTFSGASWDEAFQRAVEGLRPGDQGGPDDG